MATETIGISTLFNPDQVVEFDIQTFEPGQQPGAMSMDNEPQLQQLSLYGPSSRFNSRSYTPNDEGIPHFDPIQRVSYRKMPCNFIMFAGRMFREDDLSSSLRPVGGHEHCFLIAEKLLNALNLPLAHHFDTARAFEREKGRLLRMIAIGHDIPSVQITKDTEIDVYFGATDFIYRVIMDGPGRPRVFNNGRIYLSPDPTGTVRVKDLKNKKT